MIKYLSIFLLIIVFTECIDTIKVKKAKVASDELLEKIAVGKTDGMFPASRFSPAQTESIMDQLRLDCDFINRRGNFVNDFYKAGTDYKRVSFLYEFYLKCDSVRIIITFDIDKEIALYGFSMESIEKENNMITKPESCLKYGVQIQDPNLSEILK